MLSDPTQRYKFMCFMYRVEDGIGRSRKISLEGNLAWQLEVERDLQARDEIIVTVKFSRNDRHEPLTELSFRKLSVTIYNPDTGSKIGSSTCYGRKVQDGSEYISGIENVFTQEFPLLNVRVSGVLATTEESDREESSRLARNNMR